MAGTLFLQPCHLSPNRNAPLPVSELLGTRIENENNADNINIAEQLSRINEQLTIKNRRSHRIWEIIGVILLILAIAVILPKWNENWHDLEQNIYHFFSN